MADIKKGWIFCYRQTENQTTNQRPKEQRSLNCTPNIKNFREKVKLCHCNDLIIEVIQK